ncbi:3,4-dihydroxy-2-butanone-4-phosphate synthase [Candidatus Liberibacter sp.]|uniref:3,4-dihydroxy-2-butanone-4-phosphate synthase n=1 Tax=Candidatus Liberibacter sp. TaxID=34022 RepID=UPI0038F5F82D
MSLKEQQITEIIQTFKRGEIIVVMDEADRENEADLVLAAIHCTPEKMAFIIRYTSGIVCTPMPYKNARKLGLNLMVSENEAMHGTAFTVSVDSKHGITTGISSDDRTHTVKNLADPQSSPEDFVRPGHIFPLIARDGGVLERSGHTEAAVDLCKLAQLPPVAVICELVNDDGTIKKGKQVIDFAKKNGLKIISVMDLISWRQQKDALLIPQFQNNIETKEGPAQAITYFTQEKNFRYDVLVVGNISKQCNVPMYLHRENFNVFDKKKTLDLYIQEIFSNGRGIVIYLHQDFSNLTPQDWNDNSISIVTNTVQKKSDRKSLRETYAIAQILKNLNVRSVLTTDFDQSHVTKLKDLGIEVNYSPANYPSG